ncbi:hypothetical protein EJB05_46970, partial [Eragrostis curvula]
MVNETMGDREKDSVWEHGESKRAGFVCKYCKLERKGGGVTRLKQHLAGRGNNVVHCTLCPNKVRDYFRRELDRTKERSKHRAREKMRIEEVCREENVSQDEDDDDDELQAAMHTSRQHHEYETRSRAQGGQYKHGGARGSQKGGGFIGFLKRTTSKKGKGGGSSELTYQPRIDVVLPSEKSKNARRAIGKAWAKWMHIEAIAGNKADNPYFNASIKETQRSLTNCCEGVQSPTGREINGIYLDATEADIKKQFDKFKLEWKSYGVTLMCDSWTGPTKMSIINFMVYCSGGNF